jgi:hypothetical protein
VVGASPQWDPKVYLFIYFGGNSVSFYFFITYFILFMYLFICSFIHSF